MTFKMIVLVCFIFICISSQLSSAYVVSSQYDWGEPDTPIFPIESRSRMSRETAEQRLMAVKQVLQEYGVDAYIVPTADAHNSQYIAASDARREWLSGLSGSSGTAVVTSSHALVWTDGRYFTQFYLQVDTNVWSLMRQGTDLAIPAWLVANMRPGQVVGIDPTTYTRTSWRTLETALSQVNVILRPISQNLVDIARANIGDPAPPRPNNALLPLPINFTGKRSSEKISELMTQIRSRGAAALVLTALDDIAYTLNIRGSDIPYNPVFFSYLVLRPDQSPPNNVVLSWGDGTLAANITQHLASEGTQIATIPYQNIFDFLKNMTSELPRGSTIWLSQDGSHAIHLAAEADGAMNTLSTVSPVALMKCIKNEVELKGFRSAHIKDGIAVVRFLRWVHESVSSGVNVTEIDVSDKLEELRHEEQYFMGPSFATIAGAGENGAIIHYKPSREGEQRVVKRDDMLLVDSGAQYMDGTTDITRTRHMSSSPTPEQRLTFTRVLKGQILLGTAVFPKGSTGNLLETLARKALWDVGLNYAHGTGHGVGHFLNVHEGPSGIGAALMASDPGIVPGMIFSDEPGYYEVGEYGIRHEDLVEVIEINKDADHIFAKGMVGNFSGAGAVGFYTISLAPHQTACLDVSILDDNEIKYINDYHARVLRTLGPILLDRGLTEDYEFLEKECAPIQRSAAILISATPLAVIGVLSLWLNM
ncbi:PREDICTED: probable Xaa-Pro aminopeptidase P [Papilio xuthus]|uniref:Probable Xaa-Pro aminopeptidase P n=1 Tax=Papilio xuthus TaxID=66420 RepID=A0AAJ6Z1K3_PAPXU|nr:PREDICTED: probable Xaa-Pro aminopeptidase P [Papilio xuthus]